MTNKLQQYFPMLRTREEITSQNRAPAKFYDTSFTVGPKKHRMNFLTSLPAQKV
mgnify:CR=1 FL=1